MLDTTNTTKDIIRMTDKHLIVKVGDEKAYIDNIDDAYALIELIEYESSMLNTNIELNTRIHKINRHHGITALNYRVVTVVHVIGGFYTLAIEDGSSYNVAMVTVTNEDLIKIRADILNWC